MNIHSRYNPDLVIDNKPYKQEGSKPTGFWYAIDHEWIEWCGMNDFRFNTLRYHYSLDIDKSDMLILSTPEDVLTFAELHEEGKGYIKKIAWEKLTDKYTGIEINNYYKFHWLAYKDDYQYSDRVREVSLLWHDSWDVSSGCIWDTSIIKGYEPVDINVCQYGEYMKTIKVGDCNSRGN